jgi:hypothetical protein
MPTFFTTTELGAYAIFPLDHDPANPCEECIAFGVMDRAGAPAAEWLITRPSKRVCRWCAEDWAQTYWRIEQVGDPADHQAYQRVALVEPPALPGTL